MDVKVTAQSFINPTEDETKVERALRNIFPAEPMQKTTTQGERTMLTIHATEMSSLSTLRILIRQERIRSAARAQLLRGSSGQRIRFYLNKQVAYVGRVSFCEPEGESPHGPISVEIESANPESVVDFLASSLPIEPSREFSGRRRR